MRIEALTERHWPSVAEIYHQGITTGQATFETRVPDWGTWDTTHFVACRYVATDDGRVVGWAALTPASHREVYAGVAEVSVYVAEEARAKGVGRALLEALVVGSEQAGLWTLQAAIFPENIASLGLHEACGFRTVGRRERIARLADVWRDVVLMERRSPVID